MTPEPRPGVRDVEPYVSPHPPVAVRLNTNECPVPLPDGFSEDLAATVRDLPLNRYPDGQMTRLREDLAAHVGHPFDGTWAANGSNEILTELLLAYGGPGRTAVVFEPTYLLHSRLATLTSTALVSFDLVAPFTIGDGAIGEAAAAGPDVVFVCSPNNPTGNAQPIEATRALAETVDALVIVDEAYIEFGGESALKLVADHPNVVVDADAQQGVRAGRRAHRLLPGRARGRARPPARAPAVPHERAHAGGRHRGAAARRRGDGHARRRSARSATASSTG